MESETFKSRILKLLQKSRQAFRLYASWGKSPRGDGAEFTDMQAEEWRNINAEIIKELTAAVERPNQRETSSLVFALRDRFLNDFRLAEAELKVKQKELLGAAEKGDFIKAAVTSRALVALKARVQATQAAQHELDSLLAHCRIQQQPITLNSEQVVEAPAVSEQQAARLAPVIPLRKFQAGM